MVQAYGVPYYLGLAGGIPADYPSPIGWRPPQAAAPDLSGVWRGSQGDILIIRGDHFRIHNEQGLYGDGTYRIFGSRFLAQVPVFGVTRQYELALLGDRFVLRDEAGQLLVFERLGRSTPDDRSNSL